MQRMCEEGSVVTCSSVQCSWNEDEECFAPGIEVGGNCPVCDTYTTASVSGMGSQEAMVSHCEMANCRLNQQKHCMASGVTVGNHAGHADCVTFRP